jgi:hypothetical protein
MRQLWVLIKHTGDYGDDKDLNENYLNDKSTQKNSLYFLIGIIDSINF